MCVVMTPRTLVYAQYRGTDAFFIVQSKLNRLKDSRAVCVWFFSTDT